jgi:hypothetical protein
MLGCPLRAPASPAGAASAMSQNPESNGWYEVMATSGRTLATISAAMSLVLGACSAQHATYAPDGRRAYVINCDGYLNSYSSCLVKAGRACGGKGYDVVRGGEDERSLMVACKAP